jgi:zinc transport system substrate-binding protein
MKMKLLWIILFAFLLPGLNAGAQTVIATTSWTAAFASAAGAEDVGLIAPAGMLHPSEYELSPADIIRLKRADLIIYAGYEVMVRAIRENLDIPEERLLQIDTRNDIQTIEASLKKIGRALGTEERAERASAEIKELITRGKREFSVSGMEGKTVWVHTFQIPLAESLGIKVDGIFGPAPMTASMIAEAAEQGVDLIIDNVHNPVSGPVKSVVPDVISALWRNFPERVSSDALFEVISGNIDVLNGLLPLK